MGIETINSRRIDTLEKKIKILEELKEYNMPVYTKEFTMYFNHKIRKWYKKQLRKRKFKGNINIFLNKIRKFFGIYTREENISLAIDREYNNIITKGYGNIYE